MKKGELTTIEDYVHDFSEEDKKLFEEKLKEHHLKHIDIVIFINCVGRNLTAEEVAIALGISISSCRYRLKKIREIFPGLRVYNQNLPRKKPFKAPKHFSRSCKEAVENHQSFSEHKHCKIDKKFRQRDLTGREHDYLLDPNDTNNDIVKEF